MGIQLTAAELAALTSALEKDPRPNPTTILLKLKLKHELSKKLGF